MGEQEALTKIKNAVESNPVMLFMKGTPSEPMCGFSAQVVHILNKHGIKYESMNVLEDWDIREGIKKFANWPTIPQLYVKGKFIGGCDITMELERKGELGKILEVVKN